MSFCGKGVDNDVIDINKLIIQIFCNLIYGSLERLGNVLQYEWILREFNQT